MDAVKRLRESWDASTCYSAASNGHIECLRYAHENGCPWDEATCSDAAWNGHIECLRYARENGCPWDDGTCASAAWSGRIECLRYAHEHGCPWNAATSRFAALNGHIECLRYARDNGCPITPERADVLKRYEDAVTSLGVGMALSHRNEGGHISLREFLPSYLEHRRARLDLQNTFKS